MRNHRRRRRLFRRLVLGLALAMLAAPAAQARNDDGLSAPSGRTLVRHADGPAQPSWLGVNPRALPRDSHGTPAVASDPAEGLSDWGPLEMALAGGAYAATLFGVGLLLTVREGRRIDASRRREARTSTPIRAADEPRVGAVPGRPLPAHRRGMQA
jgi:hypothetical protein